MDRVKKIQFHMNKYKYKVSLQKLGISKYFQFSTGFRKLIHQESLVIAAAGGGGNISPK
jgi:UDP-N-acetylglucosamine transferase subunit ALG13